MKNIKGDILWGFLLLMWVIILVVPVFRTVFVDATEAHPYIGGFIKFFFLASMGDMLGGRILKGSWKFPQHFFLKAVVWGILGMMITLVFTVFYTGTLAAQAAGRLPFDGSNVASAVLASVIMNMTFGPMLYIYHKFGDLFVDLIYERTKGIYIDKINVSEMVNRVDWHSMVNFFWLKTCTLIWIPCHSLVFLMPPQYRVLASAFLSILLGVIVAFTKKYPKKA